MITYFVFEHCRRLFKWSVFLGLPKTRVDDCFCRSSVSAVSAKLGKKFRLPFFFFSQTIFHLETKPFLLQSCASKQKKGMVAILGFVSTLFFALSLSLSLSLSLLSFSLSTEVFAPLFPRPCSHSVTIKPISCFPKRFGQQILKVAFSIQS